MSKIVQVHGRILGAPSHSPALCDKTFLAPLIKTNEGRTARPTIAPPVGFAAAGHARHARQKHTWRMSTDKDYEPTTSAKKVWSNVRTKN
jgi:hypothetical protein